MNHLRHKQRKLYTLFLFSLGATVFTAIFLMFILIANWGAVKAEIAYNFRPEPLETPLPLTTPTPAQTPTPIVEPAHIVISKIGADIPVSWDVPVDQTIEYLNKGVAHLMGTARLGEIGNLFITGHSSDYVWKKNPYAAAFALLPKLQVGDTIELKENGKTYIYKLVETKIVNPDQVEVTKPTTTPVLTLMTCYPIGSTRQRYIVHASLVSSPDKLVSKTSQDNSTLPEIKFR